MEHVSAGEAVELGGQFNGVVVTKENRVFPAGIERPRRIAELHQGRSPWRLFRCQLIWALVGVAGLFVALRTPLLLWRGMVVPFLGVGFALMCQPLITGVGNR